ncbi:MAG: helix-turn-helix domain-containing protein [Carboxylicivirga sp.]|jgi:predicted DNA-binding transcriptional regulator AlpA|nr:helix-turn-helix domain-containing protein [Carboxylicivirga sp.]
MKLDELLKLGSQVKIEVTIDDLLLFAEYIIHNSNKSKSNSTVRDSDIGGIDLAMEVTGYAKSTIYNMVSGNKIPYFRKHGRLYFSRSDLLSFIKSGRHEAGQQGGVINILK